MRLVFMGTPDFSVPSLEALYTAGHEIVGVFTQPDRPAGRGNKITACPVKILAQTLKLPLFQPAKIKTPEIVNLIKNLQPECIIVVAFGQILSKEILQLPPFGCVNVHASLLPAYRGAAPIHWAVINGESLTGVTTMLMDEGLDTGDMLLAREYRISSSATTGEVHDALAKIGAEVLIETIQGLEKGILTPIPQPTEFTYAPLLKREHEKLEWSWNSATIHNRIRGLNPWPGAFTTFRHEQVKIWQGNMPDGTVNKNKLQGAVPGQIIALTANGFMVQTGEGAIEIAELQPAGKKKMKASDFFNGRRVQLGECFS
ncbi:MAG: methionyl-tRNA formyltransferase [Peptococcaceae bacterium]|nr:methionyl-tRNA formyltransferase [Peptococcaceae bacterium]